MPAKKKIAILTLHPENRGGILSSLRVVYNFCYKFFEPTVFFLGFDPEISAHVRQFQNRTVVRHKTYYGMRCVEIGSRWAFWEPGHYQFTLKDWQRELDGFEYFFVTSGTSIAAHPLVMLKKKYLLWTATPYDDDRDARRTAMTFLRKSIEWCSAPFMRKIECEILQSSSRIVPMSSYACHRFAHISGINHEKMDVCGYPINTIECDFKIKTQRKIAVAIGRFDDPRKNAAMLFRVWEKVIRRIPDAQLVVIGRKPQEILCNRYAHLLNEKAILCLGQVDDAEKKAWLYKARLMLITSYQEGLGIIGLEAMAHGAAVVSTRCGGPADYVIDGQNGFLVNIDDTDAMAVCAEAVLNNLALQKAFVSKGFEVIAKKFSLDVVHRTFAANLIKIWPELGRVVSSV